MCCSFDTTAMDKQICFMLLSCMFATVYLQETNCVDTIMSFFISKLQQRNEPLILQYILVCESFTVMSRKNFLVQVRVVNRNIDKEFICTAIVKTQSPTNSLAMTDTHCVSAQRGSPRRQLINAEYFQKMINKVVDLINQKLYNKMIATSLKELTVTGYFSVYTFDLTVAKTSCFNTPRNKGYDHTACPILTDNQALSQKYFVVGDIGAWTAEPWIKLYFVGTVTPTS